MSRKKGFNRRDFLKMAGLAGITLPTMNIIGNITGYEYLASREAYGGFVVRRSTEGNPPYQVDDAIYRRFPQRNAAFYRLSWDKKALVTMLKRIAASGAMPEDSMEGTGKGNMNPAMVMQMLQGKGPPPEFMGQHKMTAKVPHTHIKRKTPGKTRLDFAFVGGAWTVATTLGTLNEGGPLFPHIKGDHGHNGLYSWSPLGGFTDAFYDLHSEELGKWDPSDYSPQELTDIIKIVAKAYGASLVGVAEVDERWFYSSLYVGTQDDPPILFDDVDATIEREDHTKIIPKSMKYVVALGFEMDYDGIRSNLMGPSEAVVGIGYSKMAFTAASLAEFFRGLGYHAIPSGNSTALSPAIAVSAGLGELGRNGIVVTPKYGPRVRLCKVITDFPLVPDRPISFGVTEFCEICGKCARECPSGAIPFGPRTWEGNDISNNPGTLKWHIHGLRCLGLWLEEGLSCGQCINVCPFNKPSSWLHEITRTMIGVRSGVIDKTLLKLDDASGYGNVPDPAEFWEKKRKSL